jgi:FK506-binding nuclear protein
MGKIRERHEIAEGQQPVSKRLKKTDDATTAENYEKPKSKKELRAEKKAARKAAPQIPEPLSVDEQKKEKQLLKKEQRKELFKEQLRKERGEKKIRQQKRLNKELNAHKSSKKQLNSTENQQSEKSGSKKKTKKTTTTQEQEVAMKVLSEIIRGSKDESGMTTTQLGVQYKDIVVGGGVAVKNKSLVTVQYKLTGGKFGAVLDSSKNFNFRAGKGEVIQGWDIGLVDMREGGRRKLIVPPKAGYGSQDIGAGSGAILYFDITVLSVRGG